MDLATFTEQELYDTFCIIYFNFIGCEYLGSMAQFKYSRYIDCLEALSHYKDGFYYKWSKLLMDLKEKREFNNQFLGYIKE